MSPATIKLRPLCKALDFNQIWNFGQIFLEVPYIKFHQNPSSRSRADIFVGQKGGWTDITNIMGAFRDFAHSP